MQNVDVTNFPNSSGWKVIHNSNNMSYELKADNGVVKPGTYTHKRFADKALFDYLSKMQDTAPANMKSKKKDKKASLIKEISLDVNP
jgi:homoaconitase/3-isopropylmalate dehydratase large subunit